MNWDRDWGRGWGDWSREGQGGDWAMGRGGRVRETGTDTAVVGAGECGSGRLLP